MKLQNLRHMRHVKWPIYIMFGFIIISFIFFYGWNQSNKRGGSDGYNQRFARLRSESYHPLKRWTYLDSQSLRSSHREAQNEKFRALPPLPEQLQQMIQQQNLMEQLVQTEDVARVAANTILLDRAARQMGVQVSLKDIIDMLKTRPGINDAILDQSAKQQGFEDKYQLVNFYRQMSEQERVRELGRLVAHASLFELWQEYSLSNEKLVLRLAAYPAEDFESKVTVTPADLEKYLADHKNQFHVPPMRRYAYVAVSRNELLSKIKPTKEQIQVYYEKNQSQYIEKAAAHVQEIWSPLPQNEASMVPLTALRAVREEAAKANDLTSITNKLVAQNAGIEFLSRARWIEEGDKAVSAKLMQLTKTMDANQGTTVVLDSEGTHLIKVTEKRTGGAPQFGTPAFEKIRTRVEADYQEKTAEAQFKAETERLKAERAKLDQDKNTKATVHLLAQRLKLNDELTTRVQADSVDLPDIGSFESDRGYLANLTEGEVSEVLTASDTAAVLQVVEQTEAYDPKFAEVKDKVEKAYRKERSVELAKQAAQQAHNVVKSGAAFDTALADAPKKPFDTGEFTRLEPVRALAAPLIGFNQQTLKINTGNTGMSPYGNNPEKPEGFAVWQVQRLIAPKKEVFEKERATFGQHYLQVAQETIVREWLADQRRTAQYQYLAAKERN